MFQSRLGVLGGGQLGAMLIQSGISFGIPVSVLESDPLAPCAQYSSHFVLGDPLNYDDVLNFGQNLDVITIEKEAVNVKALKALESMGKKVFPSPENIEMVQDKYKQKQFLQAHGIPVAPGILIPEKSMLKNHVQEFPVCLKLCRDGYDGRGVMILHNEQDFEHAFNAPSVLEEFIPIKEELAVIVSRNEAGEIRYFDPVSMVFNKKKNILDFQLCPSGSED